MRKKILITHVHMHTGGIETTLIHMLNQFDMRKYEVDLLLLNPTGDLYIEIPSNINVIFPYKKSKLLKYIATSNNKLMKLFKYMLFNKFTVKWWISSKKYDVAIAFSGYSLFVDLFAAFSYAKKKLIWIHEDFLFTYNTNENFRKTFNKKKYKYEYFDKIISVSESVKNNFLKLLPMHRKKCDYLWNFSGISNVLNTGIVFDGKFNIIAVGRLVYQKGFDRLIDVHKSLIDNGYDVKTYLVGFGKLKNELINRVLEYKVEDSFIFLGERHDVFSLMKNADLYVMSSYSEAFGMTVVESMIAGTPVVAPKITGVVDIYRHIAPKGALILTENNVKALERGIVDVIDGKKGKKVKFDYKKSNTIIRKKLEKLLGEK